MDTTKEESIILHVLQTQQIPHKDDSDQQSRCDDQHYVDRVF